MQVGVTGGIGAGKTVVCRIFKVLGIPVYDADLRARQLMEESPDLKNAIQAAFGVDSYSNGKLNRKYLADLVFPNSENVQKLNQLVHPQVAKDYAKWVQQHESIHPYVIKEAALLIESGSYEQLDYLVSVLAPEDLRISRVLARDPHRDEPQVRAILAQQSTDAVRLTKSHRVIYNDEKQSVVQQVLDFHNLLIQ